MRYERIMCRLDKGKAIIIGIKQKDKTRVDSIVLHTANLLSDNPTLLENTTIINSDIDTIYLCGHSKNGNIGSYTVEDIAHILINKCGYIGKQRLYITSCDAAIGQENSIALRLNKELQQKLNIADIMVECHSLGNTVTINNNGITEQYVVQGDRALISIGEFIEIKLNKPKYKDGHIINRVYDVSNVDKLNTLLTESDHEKINSYKKRLIKKKE